ncbi:hypothetical protein K501DRAFT_319955 [Backusella circina FSU 941]|nr:hypothetical protein K501DRAFT_319955 [Backusella circina FSU 941]
MNLEKNAQLSLYESKSLHSNNYWAPPYSLENESIHNDDLCKESLNCDSSHNNTLESSSSELNEKNQFFKEIGQVREDIVRFRTEMNGLVKQMNGMEIDLDHSKSRFREIEEDLTATQEVNVNLQVLIEKAVNKQKESDVYATQAMRHIHSNLATVFYETGQLHGRLSNIAHYQLQHKGSVTDMAEKMREYTHMLEQAQGTIQSLKSPPPSPPTRPPQKRESLFLDLSRRSSTNSYLTEDEDIGISIRKETQHTQKVDKSSLYKHRIITSSKQNNNQHWLPQKGLRILLTDFNRF